MKNEIFTRRTNYVWALCSREVADKLRDLGYNDKLLMSVPTLANAAEWIRDTYDLRPVALPHIGGFWYGQVIDRNDNCCYGKEIIYDTYEDALLAAIERALEVIDHRNTTKQ